MNRISNAPHAHVIDPDWRQDPVPWAQDGDATMAPRIHAACLDQCGECLAALAEEAADSTATTAVLMAVGFSLTLMMSPALLVKVREELAFAPPLQAMIDRVHAVGEQVRASEALAMTRDLERPERRDVVEGCIQLIGLYAMVMQTKEP